MPNLWKECKKIALFFSFALKETPNYWRERKGGGEEDNWKQREKEQEKHATKECECLLPTISSAYVYQKNTFDGGNEWTVKYIAYIKTIHVKNKNKNYSFILPQTISLQLN